MVRALRQQKGMTQEELAVRSGLSRLSIVAIESNGLSRAKAKTVVALADSLGVDAGFLFRESVNHEEQAE
jgi:transcriptional regulator with XRE-family HTH domain